MLVETRLKPIMRKPYVLTACSSGQPFMSMNIGTSSLAVMSHVSKRKSAKREP